MTYIYGLDWTDYGIEEVYTSVADAELAVYYALLEKHINEVIYIGHYRNRETFEAEVNSLACDADSLHNDLYIDDVVYITKMALNDKFTP